MKYWQTEEWVETDRRRIAHLTNRHTITIERACGTVSEETPVGTPIKVQAQYKRGHPGCFVFGELKSVKTRAAKKRKNENMIVVIGPIANAA